MAGEMLWEPSPERIARAQVTAFMQRHAERHGLRAGDWDGLWAWSVRDRAGFWRAVWDDFGVIAGGRLEHVLTYPDRMPGAQWFKGVELNFAENLMKRRDDHPAIVALTEGGRRRELSYAELYQATARCAAGLAEAGVGVGDRVAGYLPNVPETVIAMLATTALGAIWSSGSPDFGATGILDRFGQIEPKVLVTVDGYRYGGKPLDIRPKVKEVAQALPSLRRTVVVPFLEAEPDLGGIPNAVPWSAFGPADAGALEFVRGPFERPIYVLYSSGTTGVPKAIVHGAGGTLLQHIKEHALHTDVGPDDRVFYFTTCGWMMWNWLVSGLALGATIVLYDGNPFHPDGRVLWDMAAREGVTVFGTSAKYIDALAKSDLEPGKSHDLSRLRSILSTGSPLAPESFDYVYSSIKEDVQLASISGGTDIVSCFALGNPIRPVYRGELQTRGLGLAVEVWNEHGKPVVAQKGELVCTKPFPCMPVAFWNDTDGKKYRGAYFERFPGVWHHGDFAELTPRGGVVIYGRSDAVLNPGGVRIGTAEIYRQVEQVPEVLEALCIGQDWQGDVRVVLFVRLREGETLTPEMEAHIKRRIRDSATPRHVPVRIVQVADLPRTRSGKIAELAVRDVVHGRAVANTSALANPEALDLFRDVAALQG